VVDRNFILDHPANLWQNRTNIPILQGTNKDEYSMFGILKLAQFFISNPF
jgi:hypothetical protein